MDAQACTALLRLRHVLPKMNELQRFKLHMKLKAARSQEMEMLYNLVVRELAGSLPKSVSDLTIENPG